MSLELARIFRLWRADCFRLARGRRGTYVKRQSEARCRQKRKSRRNHRITQDFVLMTFLGLSKNPPRPTPSASAAGAHGGGSGQAPPRPGAGAALSRLAACEPRGQARPGPRTTSPSGRRFCRGVKTVLAPDAPAAASFGEIPKNARKKVTVCLWILKCF